MGEPTSLDSLDVKGFSLYLYKNMCFFYYLVFSWRASKFLFNLEAYGMYVCMYVPTIILVMSSCPTT
jgi:hypothetical protein